MGMAASQARLLFITSRQNDVSAKMQRISNQNMILARDSEEVAEKYNKMLSSTVLKVKNQGDSVDLSYDSVMGANATDVSKIVTVGDSTKSDYGKVVLSSGIASTYGLTGANGSKNDIKNTSYGKTNKAFIAHAMGISETKADELLASYKAKGGNSGGDGSSMTINLQTLLSNMTGKGSYAGGFTMLDDNSGTNLNKLGSNRASTASKNFFQTGASTACNNLFQNAAYRSNFEITQSGETGIAGLFGDYIDTSYGLNGSGVNANRAAIHQTTASLNDLYNNAGKFSGTMLLGWTNIGSSNWQTKPSIGSEVLNQLENLINAVGASITAGLTKSGFTDPDIAELVKTQSQQTYSEYSSDSNLNWDTSFYTKVASDKGYAWNDQAFDHNEDAYAAALMAAQGQKGLVAAADGNQTWIFAVDAGTLVKNMLDSIITSLVGKSNLDTDTRKNVLIDKNKDYTISSKKYTDGVSSSGKKADSKFTADEQRANYLDTLYSKLVDKGWVIDDSVGDASTFKEKLINGQYYVGGDKAQNNSGVTEEVREYTDEQAKAYYDTEKAKINRKEKQLDTELTKLQTEYSSLTQDYNSVKSILDANIQRSFAYCQNG